MADIKRKTQDVLVSFVIPTFNAEKYLERCLKSIKALNFQKERIEVIAADGGSTDGTLRILKKYRTRIIQNTRRIAEYGKYEAFHRSAGKYVVFLDADNVIASSEWLTKMLQPLEQDGEILGVESNYLLAPDFTSLNIYANLLVIVDPYARLLSAKPSFIAKKKGYIVKTFAKGSSPVGGANGFIWRRSVLQPFADDSDTLEETTILQKVTQTKKTKIGNVPKQGIYHYYCVNLKDYVNKRRKIAGKFLKRRSEKETWVDTRSDTYKVLTAIYLITIIGPAMEGFVNFIRSGRVEWLWHPIVSFITMLVYGYYLVQSKLGVQPKKNY